jgi:uncharacterized protein (TIGR02270 family)
MAVISNVLSQHAEEAALLWLARRSATDAPHYRLPDLAKLDGRVEAHLSGLRIAGEDGWAACKEQLSFREEGEVFTAAVLAFEARELFRIATVMQVVEEVNELAGSAASALGWPTFDEALPHIHTLLQSSHPNHQRIAITGAAIHRHHPGSTLVNSLQSADNLLRSRALRAAGELGDRSLADAVVENLRNENPKCRFFAARSGALLGLPEAVAVLQEIADSGAPRAASAADLVVRRMELPQATAWQKYLAEDARHTRLAVLVAGAVGEPSVVPWLTSLMSQVRLARVAGQSFTFITGVDLAYQNLETKRPKDFESGPTENPEDENVDMDLDENLPWPDPEKISDWWQKHRDEFIEGTRYLVGKPITIEWLEEVLRNGYQRQRAAAALELAIRRPGQPLFEVRAPGFRQQQLLGLK